MSVLELDGVCKTRGTGAHAVSALVEVSLRVEAGELALVEGPSGSGKTTLLAVAAGLLTPEKGRVGLSGRWLATLDAAGRRALRARSVGLVFQHAQLLPGLNVVENIVLQARLAGLDAHEALRRAQGLLEQLGLVDLAERGPDSLSGGQEQRVAVARALVHRPAVVLADEPTASLDTAAGQQVTELLALGAAAGAAVLLATHDARLAACASRRLHLQDGRMQKPESVR